MVQFNRLKHQDLPATAKLQRALDGVTRPLRKSEDLDPLLDRIAESRFVLLGEASHGTAEYYNWRAELSRRLITERGFSFIAVEGDWPDCYRINSFVKGWQDAPQRARDVLHAFNRWPTWMWANHEVLDLVEWLRVYNGRQPEDRKVGFFGLDVYSLWESLYAILAYLHKSDRSALPAAWEALRCFEPYGEDVQQYARATRFVANSCEEDVIALLREVRRKASNTTGAGRELDFVAEQNAVVLKNAEAYYRTMVRGGPDSWNIRDRHMADTLDRLMKHHGEGAKAIVWEHNTHIGDARFTDMMDQGEINLGQLVRERHLAAGVVLVGFGSYQGSVIAGNEWEAPMEPMRVPPARKGSWEEVLHRRSAEDKLLLFNSPESTPEMLQSRGHRAIGVVYHPEYEHLGNYVPTVLPLRYDAFLYFDKTHALNPLHEMIPQEGEVPETYPTGV